MNTKFAKVVALLLCLVMLVGVMPIVAFAELTGIDYTDREDDYYNVISKDDYQLAPGIVESEIVLNNDAGTHRQVAHVVEVDLSNEYTKVIPSSKGMIPTLGNYGTQIMSQQAAFAEANGYGNVVAAMNISLSWYDSAYYKQHPELVGEPLGYLVLDGQVYKNSQGQTSGAQTCVVINFDEKNGEARPSDMPKVEIRSTATAITGWEEQVIPANFGFLVKDGKNQYAKNHTSDPASRSFVGIKADGTFVMVMNDGRQAPYSTGFNSYEMAEFMLSLGCVTAVNGDGGGSSAFLSQRPGEELKLNCSPSDGAERPTTHGILVISTAPATGEFVRANITAEHDYYAPGSTVKFSALGTDLVGTAAEIPENVAWQLEDASFGTIEDGVFVSNGKEGTVVAQMVYNGAVVGEASVEVVMPETFAFAQRAIVVPFGATVNIGMKATVHGGIHEVAMSSDLISLSLSDANLGTINGLTFTSAASNAGLSSLEGTLTAVLKGTSFSTSVKLKLGAPSEVLYDFEDASDIDAWKTGVVNGYHTSGFKAEISHANTTNGEVHNGNGAIRLETNGLSAVNVSAGGYAQVPLYLQNDGIIVKDALSVGFWAYIPDEYVNCWIRVLYWYDSNGDGTYDKKNTVTVINQPEVYDKWDESGWKYFSVDVSAYSSILIPGVNTPDSVFPANNHPNKGKEKEPNDYRFIEFMFPHTNTNELWKTYGSINGPFSIYVDNITADYSEAVDDREAPIFKGVTLMGGNDSETELKKHSMATLTGNLLNVTARVAEDETKDNATGLNIASAKAYVDGVAVDCSFNNGLMSINDLAVADGVHSVKFEIADNMGNKAVVIRFVKVASGVDASTIQVVPADPTLDRLYGGSLYWMNLNATDIETIQSVKTVIDLNNTNHWELDHMVLADGFTATYTVDAETNTATIEITRTGVNTQTGAVTLASLPIRVIYYDTDIKIDGHTAQSYWNSYDFWPYDVKVDVDYGEITYVEGYASNVLNAFSNEEFSVDVEMYTSSANMDAAFKAERGTAHVHTAAAMTDVAATCTTDGYTGRTFCAVCNSVVDWGTIVKATGHNYVETDGVLKCACGELFNGELNGATYIDGVIADGWINDTYYYINGVLTTGSYFMNGKMYTFDENGVYLPNYIFEGFYETAGTVMYFVNNQYLTGVRKIVNDIYYFNDNGLGYEGEYTLCGETCVFDNGKYTACTSAEVYNAGWCGENVEYVVYKNGLLKLDGKGSTYSYSNTGNRPFVNYVKYIDRIEVGKGITQLQVLIFAYMHVTQVVFEEGSNLKYIGSGALSNMSALESINLPEGLLVLDYTAFKNCDVLTRVNVPASVEKINASTFKGCPASLVLYVQEGSFAESFAKANGLTSSTESYIRNGFYEENGDLYYYIDGMKWTTRGLFMVGDNYYYAKTGGALLRNCVEWANVTNGLLPKAQYTFDENGKIDIKNGFVEENGELYYYIAGVKMTTRGLFKVDGYYYYAKTGGALLRNCNEWANVTNNLLPKARYDFDENGRIIMKNGFYEENGELYYYVENVKMTTRGLFKVDGYYYYAKTGGALLRNCVEWANVTNDLLPKARYTFDEYGRIVLKNGFYEENGELYYYVDDVKLTTRGVFKVGDDYYYAKTGGALLRNCYEWANVTNDLVPKAKYHFDENGKMAI